MPIDPKYSKKAITSIQEATKSTPEEMAIKRGPGKIAMSYDNTPGDIDERISETLPRVDQDYGQPEGANYDQGIINAQRLSREKQLQDRQMGREIGSNPILNMPSQQMPNMMMPEDQMDQTSGSPEEIAKRRAMMDAKAAALRKMGAY